MSKKIKNYILIITLIMLLSGCSSLGMLETAETVPKDKSEWGISTKFIRYGEVLRYPHSETIFNINPSQIYAKYGVSDNFDLGISLSSHIPALGIMAKYQLFNSKISGAVSTYFAYAFNKNDLLSISPRFILSNEKKGRFPFAFNIGASFDINTVDTTNKSIALYSGFGIPFYLRWNKRIRILPEIFFVHTIKYDGEFSGVNNATFYQLYKNIVYLGVTISFKSK